MGGGEVTSHLDSTFLYTEPRQTCLGLLLFLQDATVENGCIWARPGSHREKLRRVFARSHPDPAVDSPVRFVEADDFAQNRHEAKPLTDEAATKYAAEKDPAWEREGKLPDGAWPLPAPGLFDRGFVPLECPRGTLLVFPGTLEHLSLYNQSESSRHCFQLHLIDGPDAGITWSTSNWLQYEGGKPFVELPRMEN